MTSLGFEVLNGQNHLLAGLSFMLGYNYNIQDWILIPYSIQSETLFNVHFQEDQGFEFVKGCKINVHFVYLVPHTEDLLNHIDQSRMKPRQTSGGHFFPSVEIVLIHISSFGSKIHLK